MTDKEFNPQQQKEGEKAKQPEAPDPYGHQWAQPSVSHYAYGQDPFPEAHAYQFPEEGEDLDASQYHRFYPPYFPPYFPPYYPPPYFRPFPPYFPPFPPHRPFPPRRRPFPPYPYPPYRP
ncbi:hypothetical protein [Desmospora profundinema]|uniref:Uncharacterized protein n=1 Tax=Desmospora profundinema TaxID=1571184 RepID=A0ABU1IP30_9BACL|nr:hypothetical protein [Desmospora profundinema]MDR6226143.1 hypothetical protein [Desmospora profundinema]